MSRKTRGKYTRKKAKRLNRDVISYEEVPLEDYEAESTKVSAVDARRIIKIAIILVILGLVVFAFANRSSLTPDNISNWFKYDVLGQGEGEGYPTEIIGTEIEANNFICVGNTLSYASDTSFVTLSSNASVIQNYQLSYASPAISYNSNNVLVYGLDGREFHVGTSNKFTYTGQTEDGIITGDISSSGVYGVVTKTSGYFSKLFIFDKDNSQIFAYSFADYYITSFSINPSGSKCVAFGVSASDGVLSSKAYVLDFTSEKPLAEFDLGENYIFDSGYLSANEVCYVGNSASGVIDIPGNKTNETSYDETALTAFDINCDAGTFCVSLSRSGDGHSCTVSVFSANGELSYFVDTDYKINAVRAVRGNVYVLENDTIHGFDYNKNEIAKVETGSGSKQIDIAQDGSAYILGVNEIRKVAL